VSTPPARACVICGAPAQPRFRAPQPELAPDLDLRPGEPARSTLGQWLRTCRRCGTTAPDLATLPAAARAIARDGAPEASPFLRWATLCAALGDRTSQAEALLQAAWEADDRGDASTAAAHRLQVAALWDGAADPETALRRLDVLRRADAWETAEEWAAVLKGRPLEETARAILAFQQARIAARDNGRHLISSAVRPPAHAPHVTHVRQRRPGLLARLLGRG
jgi:hypothetical protein